MAAEVVDRSARIGHTHWQAGALQKRAAAIRISHGRAEP